LSRRIPFRLPTVLEDALHRLSVVRAIGSHGAVGSLPALAARALALLLAFTLPPALALLVALALLLTAGALPLALLLAPPFASRFCSAGSAGLRALLRSILARAARLGARLLPFARLASAHAFALRAEPLPIVGALSLIRALPLLVAALRLTLRLLFVALIATLSAATLFALLRISLLTLL